MPRNIDRERKEEKRRTEKRELDELPFTEIVNSGTVRLTSGKNYFCPIFKGAVSQDFFGIFYCTN